VSLGFALGGHTRALDALAYMITQLLAGIAAVATLVVTVPSGIGEVIGHTDDTAMLLATANGWGDLSPLSRLSSGSFTFGLPTAVLMLVIGSAALVGVILAARPSGRSAIAVGATYAAILLITIPIMNGGVNPARSTGVAVLTAIKGDPAAFGQLWLFWVAPLIGGAIAGLAKLALGKRELDSWVNAADIDDDANA
jgi:aquaporin Z